MKVCTRCKTERDENEFVRSSKGIHTTCIHCKMKTKKQRAFKKGAGR
jgi:hypothetical protein